MSYHAELKVFFTEVAIMMVMSINTSARLLVRSFILNILDKFV